MAKNWNPQPAFMRENRIKQLEHDLARERERSEALRQELNAVVNFAIDQGAEASVFLTEWREGAVNPRGWPKFKSPVKFGPDGYPAPSKVKPPKLEVPKKTGKPVWLKGA